jgi:hypothetical protein
MAPSDTIMPKDSEVITFPTSDTGHDTITSTEPITIDSSSIEFTKNMEDVEDVIAPEDKPFKWHGVEFPAWAKNPHFVILQDRTFALAMDPNFVTMEMKSNWMHKYVPELVKLGKKVLEKLLDEEIKTI